MIRVSPAALALALVVAASLPAAAQDAPPASPAPVMSASPAPDAGPVLNLSLDEVVKRTLDNNADIAVEKYNPEASEESLRQLRAYYEPFLTSALNQNSNTQTATNRFAGGAKVTTDTFTYNFGAAENLPTGGAFRLDFTNNRQNSDSSVNIFNPTFQSRFLLTLSQPLLRNFAVDSNRYQIKVAKKNREISDVQFHQTVVNTVASAKQAYYDLIYAIDNLEAARKSLRLAQQLLQENEIKVRVGTLAPLDVVSAQSEVAGREAGVIAAEAAVADAEDTLKRAIFDTNDPATWATHIVPTDRPTAEPVTVDVGAAIQTALQKRTDILAARKNLESSEYAVSYARNQLLPQADVVVNYGSSGVAGTQLLDLTTGQPLASPIPGGYNNALSNVFGRDLPTWTLGVNLSYPIFNRQAAANSARARVSRDQQQASLHRLEMQITQEIRVAGRAVQTNYQLAQSTRAARVLQEQRLDAETKKFAAGMSTNFLVTQAQRDLAVAEVAELQAIANYRKSLVNFERAQEAGGGGGLGSTATVSLGGATRGGSTTSAGSSTGQ